MSVDPWMTAIRPRLLEANSGVAADRSRQYEYSITIGVGYVEGRSVGQTDMVGPSKLGNVRGWDDWAAEGWRVVRMVRRRYSVRTRQSESRPCWSA